MNRQITLATAALASMLASACVSKATYEEQVNAANSARGQLERCNTERERLEVGRTLKQKQLDDATAINDELSKELKRLGEDSQSLLASNGNLKSALDNSRKRLEELRHAQGAAEARARLFRELALKLKGMVDAGDLAITLRDGRMVLRLSNDVLFDSGKAELKPTAKPALTEIAAALSTIPARNFQVAGHTDNEPIRYSHFRSNWDLSTTRALAVVDFLIANSVSANTVSAAGFGEFDPVDTNDTTIGKAHNRRTEITLQPNIDEIVAVPDAQ